MSAETDAWVEALMRVVDHAESLLEVADVDLPPEVWSGVAYESWSAAAARLWSEVAAGQEAVRRAARALLVFGDDVAAGGTAAAGEAEARLAERLKGAHPDAPAGGRPAGPPAGASPADVADWWRSLDAAGREEFRVLAGGSVAAAVAGGAWPAVARDMVNRDAMRLDLARPAGAPERRTASATQRALARREGELPRHLLDYDAQAEGDGEVAIAVGDVDGAERVAVVVPGMTTTPEDASRYVRDIEALAAEADAVAGGGDTAGVFWLGYDAPDGFVDPATWTQARAESAGDALADDLAQWAAVRGAARGVDDPGRVSVLGHSYGSTVTAHAAAGPGVDVDAVALVGSPGAGPADVAADLGVDEVYAARDSRDPVAALGDKGWVDNGGFGLGRDPATDDFGAVRIRAERLDRELTWGGVDAHTSYFDASSESQLNLARIVAGRDDLLDLAEHAYDPWWGAPRDPEWIRKVK